MREPGMKSSIGSVLRKIGLLCFLAIMGCYVVQFSSMIWAASYASRLAQEHAPVGVSETDVRAALGKPQEVLRPGEEIGWPFRRTVDHHALVYLKRPVSFALANWIVVYIGQDGLVECSVATVTGSD